MRRDERPDPRTWGLGTPSGSSAAPSVKPLLPVLPFAAPFAGSAARPAVGGGGTWETFRSDGAASGRSYAVYVPPAGEATGPLPVVVLLHGCRQSAADAAAGTRLNELADSRGFVAVYPEQDRRHNGHACWNWFRAGDQLRDAGEPRVIADITRRVLDATLPVPTDPDRVYVVGLSAGGAMAAILGVTYPDLYAAVGVHSGVPYGAAGTARTALQAMRSESAGPDQQARLAYTVMAERARVVPLVAVHGEEDRTVAPGNADSLVRQWLTLTRLASGGALTPDADAADAIRQGRSPGGLPYTVRSWHDSSGHPIVEEWRVAGLGHTWSGGSRAGSYVDPRGPDATEAIYAFLSRHRLRPAEPDQAAAAGRTARWAVVRPLRRLRLRGSGLRGLGVRGLGLRGLRRLLPGRLRHRTPSQTR